LAIALYLFGSTRFDNFRNLAVDEFDDVANAIDEIFLDAGRGCFFSIRDGLRQHVSINSAGVIPILVGPLRAHSSTAYLLRAIGS